MARRSAPAPDTSASDLSWELLRDKQFPLDFEELLTMCGLPVDGSLFAPSHRTPPARRRRASPAAAPARAAVQSCPRSSGLDKSRVKSSKTCSMASRAMDSTLRWTWPRMCRQRILLSDRRAMSDRALVAASRQHDQGVPRQSAFRDEIETAPTRSSSPSANT